ncbi:hypothetical protein KEM55_007036, partial [Ascosphaera atra]
MTHLIDSLKPDLQVEWKRVGHDDTLEPDEILRELIRLEDVLNVQRRFDSRQNRPRPGLNALSASSQSSRPPPKYQTNKWHQWCKDNNACFNCAAKGHRRSACQQPDDGKSKSPSHGKGKG